jgi:hypothetical protein
MIGEKVWIAYIGYHSDDLTMIGSVFSDRGKAFKFLRGYIETHFGKVPWKNRETLPKDEWRIRSTVGKKPLIFFKLIWYKVL